MLTVGAPHRLPKQRVTHVAQERVTFPMWYPACSGSCDTRSPKCGYSATGRARRAERGVARARRRPGGRGPRHRTWPERQAAPKGRTNEEDPWKCSSGFAIPRSWCDVDANRRIPDQPAPTEPGLRAVGMGIGLIIGAATGQLFLSHVVFGGDLALGVAAGAGLGLLIAGAVELVRDKE